jgi:orotate phosphoribosyltransferase
MDKEEVASILLDIGAVKLNPTKPFKYASGMLSPIYTNCRVFTSFPKERRLIVDAFIEKVNKEVKNVDIIVGAGPSGISLATYLASRLNLPMAYTRSSAKTHGKGKKIEGIFKAGYRALLVSDIISTEQDIPISIETIKENGGEVVFCLAIFNNNLNIIDKFLEREKIKYCCLTDLNTLLTVAAIKKKISSEEKVVVLNWIADPKNWDRSRRDKIIKMLENTEEKIAEILLKIKAVTLNTENPYRYVSGILSPIYTDNRLLMSYHKEWQQVIESFISMIINRVGIQNIDVIAGTATAGISHAAYLAEKLGLPMIYIKATKEGDKKIFTVEGKIKKNDRVLVVEDLISTGGSSINTIRAIRENGGIIEYCIAIFTYKMEKAKNSFREEKVELHALTNINTLAKIAAKKKYIKEKEKEAIIEWTKDTTGWGKKMGFK